MGDVSESDFTFCQVGLQGDEDNLESPKTIPNIGNITISDNPSSLQTNSSSGNSTSKDSRADDSLTFKVVNMPPPKLKVIEPLKRRDVGDHIYGSQEQDAATKKPVAQKLEQLADDSLTFKVVDMPPPKLKVTEPLKRRDVGDSTHGSQEQVAITKKPVARAKFLFEKGFSQMDWLKITRTHSDLAGLKGQSNGRLISLDEVMQHKTGESIWTVLKGRVYNISSYMKYHPGGVDMLMKAAGRDCTSLFNKYHTWVNAEFLLEKCLVGILDDSR